MACAMPKRGTFLCVWNVRTAPSGARWAVRPRLCHSGWKCESMQILPPRYLWIGRQCTRHPCLGAASARAVDRDCCWRRRAHFLRLSLELRQRELRSNIRISHLSRCNRARWQALGCARVRCRWTGSSNSKSNSYRRSSWTYHTFRHAQTVSPSIKRAVRQRAHLAGPARARFVGLDSEPLVA